MVADGTASQQGSVQLYNVGTVSKLIFLVLFARIGLITIIFRDNWCVYVCWGRVKEREWDEIEGTTGAALN